jgi:hypothetical protein
MLYQKSFEIITLVQGKDAARGWKKSLRISFLQSHWLLPYPQNHGFMRKSKETGQVMWWSSVHQGLKRYYQRLAINGALPCPLPASYIEHHPHIHWKRAADPSDYMDYTVQPEQHLLCFSDEDVYQQLQNLQDRFNQSPDSASSPASTSRPVVFEVQDPSYIAYHARTPMDTWDVNTCSQQLSNALQEYEILQHSERNLRRQHRLSKLPDQSSEPQANVNPGSEVEDEATSDEDSLDQRAEKQIVYIQQIERHMYPKIIHDRKEYKKPRLYEGSIKELAPQLQKLPYHDHSILPLIKVGLVEEAKQPPPPKSVAFYCNRRK